MNITIYFHKQKDNSFKIRDGSDTSSKVLNIPQNESGPTLLPSSMTCKKDSGYGSQGQLKLEKLRLPDENNLNCLIYITKNNQSFDSETDSPSSGFSLGSPPIRPVIIPKEEKDLAEFYDRLNLE